MSWDAPCKWRRGHDESTAFGPEVRHMAILPICSFPVRASDQADVIRIFLDLMCEKGRPPEGTTNGAAAQCWDSVDAAFPFQMPDLD